MRAPAASGPALIGISTDGTAIAVDVDHAPHILVCTSTGGGSTTILRNLTAQFLHQGAHALVLDPTRISHLWAKDLPTVTHRGNVAGIHDALVGLAAELKRRTDLDGVPRLMAVFDRVDDTLRHLARYWETFRHEGDPKKSPAISVLEDVLYEGRQARIHVLYNGQASGGGLSLLFNLQRPRCYSTAGGSARTCVGASVSSTIRSGRWTGRFSRQRWPR
ncbi:hypothetical protein [Streptomyces bobili]|uniref:hypothetical protein n=1 Tax=Streptomyces bobili TaxID=67280 RepID=UPI0037FA5426